MRRRRQQPAAAGRRGPRPRQHHADGRRMAPCQLTRGALIEPANGAAGERQEDKTWLAMEKLHGKICRSPQSAESSSFKPRSLLAASGLPNSITSSSFEQCGQPAGRPFSPVDVLPQLEIVSARPSRQLSGWPSSLRARARARERSSCPLDTVRKLMARRWRQAHPHPSAGQSRLTGAPRRRRPDAPGRSVCLSARNP